jgi:flagella basal body P-ring formation protein FlgA
MQKVFSNFDLIFRTVILLVTLSLAVLFFIAGAKSAFAASLKPVATIEDNLLTAGDLFDGLSDSKASFVLGPAPLPGKDMTLNSKMLYHIASSLDLPWRPAHMGEQITVKRAATLISSHVIENEVIKNLKEKGIGGRFNVHFTGNTPQLILPHTEEAKFEVTRLNLDHQSDRFEANIVAPSIENPVAQLNISGSVERLISVPVLKDTIRTGSLIGEHDIAFIDIKEKELQHDFVLNKENITGMTPRRIINAGKPIRTIELQPPQLVARGEMVTIIFKDNAMTLTAQGKALQSGAKGDIIRVVNTSSNRSIQTYVSGSKEVSVNPVTNSVTQ